MFKKLTLLLLTLTLGLFASGQTTISQRILSSSDDAEETLPGPDNFRSAGNMDLESSDIELGAEGENGVNPQISGLRFTGLNIPAGAIIQSAYIQFKVDNTNKNEDPTELFIFVEEEANPATFSSTAFDISNRSVVDDSVAWNIDANTWGTIGEAGPEQRSSNIAALVQEAVNNPEWEQGNAMAFYIKGTGLREAASFDSDPEGAAQLIVTYTPVTSFMTSIATGSDDAEEYFGTPQNDSFRGDGSMDVSSSDIELGAEEPAGKNPQISGLRFTGVDVPEGAAIQSAYIQFTVDNTTKNEDPANYFIFAEDAASPATFTVDDYNITSRNFLMDSVAWNVDANTWTEIGATGMDERTTDISSLVQSLVNSGDWSQGNPMAFYIKGTGVREAESFEGDEAGAAKLIINFVPVAQLGVAIQNSSDDAEEYFGTPQNDSFRGDGSMDVTSSDIELGAEEPAGKNPQISGLRFAGLDIPANAIIQSAYIQFTVDENGKNEDPANYFIFAEDNVNPATFSDADYNITSRDFLMDSVAWDIPTGSWSTVGAAGPAEATSDITSLVQQLVEKEGWSQGNAMAFYIKGTGVRVAESFDGEQAAAARLVVEYLAGEIIEVPELVREIPDQTLKVGWSLSLDTKPYFIDRDSELSFEAYLIDGSPLPSELSFNNGVLSGSFSQPTALPVMIKAKSMGDSISDQFMIFAEPNQTRLLSQISSIDLGGFDEGAAEISAFDAGSQRLFVTNSQNDAIEIIDMSDPTNVSVINSIDITGLGGGVNSVAVYEGKLAAAIEASNSQDDGFVYVFDVNGNQLWNVTVGPLPDMVTFSEDGTKILVANEGEPSGDYLNDPEGSISIIDTTTKVVSTADFTAFNGQEASLEAEGVRIFGPNATVAQDLEPEYITVSGDTAFVALQENNAIAVVEISSATVVDIYGLGYKDHSLPGQGLDVPGVDPIFISNWPFKGVYMPDAITTYTVNGKKYILTANEGDAREYFFDATESECNAFGGMDWDEDDGCLSYTDESEIGDVVLDESVFPNAEEINLYANGLGISLANADTNANGELQEIFTYGARSFSIWDAETGDLVFDSGDALEQITATLYPENFNASDDDVSKKDRSDNKGPEPEAVTVGEVNGTIYAFVALERIGGIMVYNIDDPANPEFVEYVNNRDFSTDPETQVAIHGDNGPEGLVFVPATDSPNNTALLIVSNEVSGTVTTYTIGEAQPLFTLGIFHNNDGESDLLPDTITVNGIETTGGGIGQFKYTLDSLRMQADMRGYETVMLSSGDNFLAGLEYNASQANGIYYDAAAIDSLDYDAIDLGNHDFDFGTQVLSEFISAITENQAPYLSSNLSFEIVPELQALVDNGRIRKSTIVEKDGEQIGVIGLTTPLLPTISSPGNTIVSDSIVDSVQVQVDMLIDMGVNKIILISHLQGLDEDIDIASRISGVDIVIAGGGDELLANDPTLGDPYNLSVVNSYPIVTQDLDGNDVYIVTTPGNYRYIGNLLVDFDAEGHVTRVYDSNPVLITGPADQNLVTSIEDPIREYIGDLATNVIAQVEDTLDFRRENLRNKETNGGNLFADAMLYQAQATYDNFGVDEPVIALQNSGGLRIESLIDEGNFTEDLTYEVAAFTNIVSVVEDITPEALLALMEHGVANAPTLDGRFPQIAGFEIIYDPAQPGGDRIKSITLDDGTVLVEDSEPVSGAPSVAMATIDFTAGGGDGYPFEDLGLTYTTLGATYQQAFLNYIVNADALNGVIPEALYPFDAEPTRIIEQITIAEALSELVISFDTACTDDSDLTEYHEGDDLIDCTTEAENILFNGFGVGTGASWLISPRIAFDTDDYTLQFRAENDFGRTAGPDVEVYYSTDYVGIGDPTGFTWTLLSEPTSFLSEDPKPTAPTSSQLFDVSNITEEGYIAFVYYSDNTGSGGSSRFRLFDLAIQPVVPVVSAGLQSIPAIQGSGDMSPFENNLVITGGIVTKYLNGTELYSGAGWNSNIEGFYIQSSTGDGDPTTSDALFVSSTQTVSVGDSITFKGTVSELFGLTQVTDIDSLVIVSSGNTLPASASLDFPVDSMGIFEAHEGMLVSIVDEMFVTETYNLGSFGEALISADGILKQPTQVVDPNDDPASGTTASGNSNVAAVTALQMENDLKSITLDDAREGSNLTPVPYLDGNGTLVSGSSITNLSGILTYGFGTYRIFPDAAPSFNYETRESAPAMATNTNVRVAAFNVLNYFNGDGQGGGFPTSRGASTEAEFGLQSAKIVTALMEINADIVGLMEIENDANDGFGAIESLVDSLNAQMGAGTYDFVNTGIVRRSDDSFDEIKVAFIYKPATVNAAGDYAVLNNDFDPNYFDNESRPAVAQTFEVVGTELKFTAVVNHFKSKGSGCNDLGDPDDGDGQGNCNVTRTMAAGTLASWLETDPTGSGDNDFMILGDLNAYFQEDPIDTLRARGYESVTDGDDYSYVFEGQYGNLDYAMVNDDLMAQVADAYIWKINSTEPRAIGYDGIASLYDESAYRSSDHDPVIVDLSLSVVGFDQFSFDSDLNAYPNPTSGMVNFNKELTGTVHDQLGVEVAKLKNARSIDMTPFHKGMYFIRLDNGHAFKIVLK